MSDHARLISALRQNIQTVIHGQSETIDLVLVCLLAEGHLLIEDVPGVGKTSLARALTGSLGGVYHRIQFTPDLLPSDVTGVSIYHQGNRVFEFHAGPVFSNIVLADEINRASPKTQSALLEVMEERRVTVDGDPHAVPRPFMVAATQNPVDMDGTYRLPEAQLDRFLMRISMGYPDHESEVTVLATHGPATHSAIDAISPVATTQNVLDLIYAADSAYVARPLLDYIVELTAATRHHPDVRLGVSPRGSLALLRAARARATLAERDYVNSEDVQALAHPVLTHRIMLTPQTELRGASASDVIDSVLSSVATPEERVA